MEWRDIFKVMKGNVYDHDYSTQQASHSYLMRKKSFTDKHKFRKLSTTKPALQQMLEELLLAENRKEKELH